MQLQMWPSDQRTQHLLRAYYKCSLSGPSPDLLRGDLHFNKIPGDFNAYEILGSPPLVRGSQPRLNPGIT